MVSRESIGKRWDYFSDSAVRDRRCRSGGCAAWKPSYPNSPSAVDKRHQCQRYRENPGATAQAQCGGRARDSRVDADRPVVELVSRELDAAAGAEPLLGLSEPRKEFADDHAVPGIRIVIRACSLGVPYEIMPELGV